MFDAKLDYQRLSFIAKLLWEFGRDAIEASILKITMLTEQSLKHT